MTNQLSLFAGVPLPVPSPGLPPVALAPVVALKPTPNLEPLKAAQTKLKESADKFAPLGRPTDSSCACMVWPCPCSCHKDRSRKPK